MDVYDTHVENPLVSENAFRRMAPEGPAPLPFTAARPLLPSPSWEGHDDAIRCYWKAWELAFSNLRAPAPGSGFISTFIDTAFNDCLFLWDSAFALLFGRYGTKAFDFQRTLNNFYARQHADGFICRELRESDGRDCFERFDPASTGPNILPWCEWEYFTHAADRQRLASVFPVLLAYTHWFRKHRSWPDGSYWSCGWGCGMDNQPRLPPGYAAAFDHGHMSWIDTTCQQVFANRVLLDMARVLGRTSDVADLASENQSLTALVNQRMWNPQLQYYTDRFRDGSLSTVKSIASYWALLADIVPPERLEPFVAHLSNAREFNRPHRVPSLSADHADYDPDGGYWRGAVWAPTTYMVLRGLSQAGQDALAHEIGLNHLTNVVSAFCTQGTLFENYAPESAAGRCKRNFVGWTGLPPIAVLFEYVFGLRPQAGLNNLRWDIRLLDAHGVSRYPCGSEALLDLHCDRRQSPTETPRLRLTATRNMSVTVTWPQGQQTVNLIANQCFTSPS